VREFVASEICIRQVRLEQGEIFHLFVAILKAGLKEDVIDIFCQGIKSFVVIIEPIDESIECAFWPFIL
jgi:hypothetical protein